LRLALVIGAFALILSGSVAVARAGQPASVVPNQSSSQSFAVNSVNPDMAEWTSQFPALKKSSGLNPHIRIFASHVLSRTSRLANRLTSSALRFLGVPYVFGGTSRNGFDCSGYVQHVFAMVGLHLPRMADGQFYAGARSIGGPRPGDLVFFQTYLPGPSHVGIYLGRGKFVHASSHGVMVSQLSESYWSTRYLGSKRYIASR
jgi:cell wall-associated NlpC family hydrolase